MIWNLRPTDDKAKIRMLKSYKYFQVETWEIADLKFPKAFWDR